MAASKLSSVLGSTAWYAFELGVLFYMMSYVIPHDIIQGVKSLCPQLASQNHNDDNDNDDDNDDSDQKLARMRRRARWTLYGRGINSWRSHGLSILVPSFTVEMVLRLLLRYLRGAPGRVTEFEAGKLQTFVDIFCFARDIGISFIAVPPVWFEYDEFAKELRIQYKRLGGDDDDDNKNSSSSNTRV